MTDVQELLREVRHPDADVRLGALVALGDEDHDLAAGAAVRALRDDSEDVIEAAERILSFAARPELVDDVIAVSIGDENSSAAAAVRVLGTWMLPRAGVAILFATMAVDDPVKEAARGIVERHADSPAMAALQELGVEPGMIEVGNDEGTRDLLVDGDIWPHFRPLLDRAAESENWGVRQELAELLAHAPPEDSTEILRSFCDDDDEDVRREALRAFARLPDDAVPSMVLTALSDEDEDVRDAARELLDNPSQYPMLQRLEAIWGPGTLDLHREHLDDVLRWGQRIGASFLRQRVKIVGWRGGAGRTHFAKKGKGHVHIEINVEPLFVAGPLGEDVVKGVIVHELGHHAYDYRAPGFKTASGLVRSRKIHPVWNMLLDERLERRIRSEQPRWGRLVDRMNAWLIQSRPQRVPLSALAEATERPEADVVTDIEAERLPGRLQGDGTVVLGPWDVVSFPGLVPPLHSFFLGLMAVRDHSRIADEGAREALSLIPAHLKDVDHHTLARLTVRIARLLGIDDGGHRQRRRFARQMGRFGSLMGNVRRLMDRAQRGRPAGNWTAATSSREISARLNGRAGPVLKPPPERREFDPRRKRGRGFPSSMLNLGTELDFRPLEYETELKPDIAGLAELRAAVRPHLRHVRSHFERLGRTLQENEASRRGRRLDMARVKDLVLLGRPNALIHSEEIHAPDAYVGLLIDRSGSMQTGDRMPLARQFGVLLAEAGRGLRGIEGHVNSFDGDTFYRLGNFQRHAIPSLDARGGNNDSGALLRAAQLALASRRRNRMIVMISDGLPAECSVASLRNLVAVLGRKYDIALAQVAVAPLTEVCFPHFLDVSGVPTGEAVRQFGRLLMNLTRSWR